MGSNHCFPGHVIIILTVRNLGETARRHSVFLIGSWGAISLGLKRAGPAAARGRARDRAPLQISRLARADENIDGCSFAGGQEPRQLRHVWLVQRTSWITLLSYKAINFHG